jgi:acylphosphatase
MIRAMILALLLAGCVPAWGQIVFRDASGEAGLAKYLNGALHHGLAWGDFDGDGRLDLFLGNFADRGANPKYGLTEAIPNGLYRQGAPGKFTPLPMAVLRRPGRTSGAVLGDFDNDGLLDLYVSNNTHERKGERPGHNEPSALYRNVNGALVDVSKESGAVPPDGFFGRDVIAFDYDHDGLLDLLVCEDKIFRKAGHTRLFRNLGNFRFEDVTRRLGLPEDLDAFGAAVGDVNGDGYPDTYFTSCNRLYLGGANGVFTEAAGLRPMFEFKGQDAEDYITGAMFADIDNDGDLDLLVGIHHVPSRVRVYLNEGTGADGVPKFRDVTKELGIPVLPNKGATCDVGDFDNDGLPDLYWSVWFAEHEARRPFICRGLGVKDGLPRFDVPSVDGIPLNRKNLAPAAGQKGMVYFVNGPAVDYDGDGRLDFFAGTWPDENSKLFHNETKDGNHWLEVKVVGDGERLNRMGVGAKVRVGREGKLVGFREITLCGGYSGTRAAIAHFGLGVSDKAVDIEVEYPGRRGGPVTTGGSPIDRLITIELRGDGGRGGGRGAENGMMRKHWLIGGEVQGVGFRAFTHRHARDLGLKGWVRNLTNGEVEVVAEGPARSVEELFALVKKGPLGSKVDSVREADVDANEALADFEVRDTARPTPPRGR